MGRRGPMPKPADKVLGHRRRRPPVPKDLPPQRPAGRDDWLPTVTAAWETYWASELARLSLDVDLPSIYRLFDMYDQHGRAMDVVRKALVVRGSTGQIRANPLADLALRLDASIVRLENELGVTPAARGRMGIRISAPETPRLAESNSAAERYGHLRVVNA